MNIARIILLVIAIIFAILGLFKILPFSIVNQIILFAVATVIVLKSIELKKSQDNNSFIILICVASILYLTIICNIII